MSELLSPARIDQVRADLPYLRDITYVDAAAVSPVPRSVQVAADRYNELTVYNLRDVWQLSQSVFEQGRVLAAGLIGARAEQIAYV